MLPTKQLFIAAYVGNNKTKQITLKWENRIREKLISL